MKYTLNQFQERLPAMNWDSNTLADKLSLIGHETEVNGDNLDVTLTSNRKDCKDFSYLLFDLAGIYNFELLEPPTNYGHGPEIVVTAQDINKLLGSSIEQSKLDELKRLGFIVTEHGVQPPDFRDISTIADVAEEVFRLIGITQLEIAELSHVDPNTTNEWVVYYNALLSIKSALRAAGLTETITSSFSSHGRIELKNPFTETEPFLREDLLDGLLRTLAKNPYLKRAGFYEIGTIYNDQPGMYLGIILAGYKSVDELQKMIAQQLKVEINFLPVEPEMAATFDVKQGKLFWAQLAFPASLQQDYVGGIPSGPLPKFKPISKFPPLLRSITEPYELNDEDVELISSALKSRGLEQLFPELLLSEVTDLYTNPESNKTTITYRLVFQKMDSSFTETEISSIDDRIKKHFPEAQ